MCRSSFRAFCAVSLATGLAIPAFAAPVTTTASKTIIWSIGKAPAATDLNEYTWDLSANATGPKPAAPDAKSSASPAKSPTWAGNAALPATMQTSGKANSGGATAEATVTFSSSAPIMVAPGSFQVTTNMEFANTLDKNGLNASLNATGQASVSLKGGNAEAAIITQPNGVMTAVKLKGGTINFGPDPKAKGVWKDPLSVSVTDVTTGSVVGSSMLGDDNGSYTGAGTFEWDSSGIELTAPDDGASSAELDFAIGGAWVSNSSSGTVSLENGTFVATGAFASLPWVLDNPADPQSASLSPSFVPSLEMDYQVPSALLNGNDTYQPELDFNGVLSDSVPEPTGIALSGIVALALSRRHRRIAP